jgi:hypothetical protein
MKEIVHGSMVVLPSRDGDSVAAGRNGRIVTAMDQGTTK